MKNNKKCNHKWRYSDKVVFLDAYNQPKKYKVIYFCEKCIKLEVETIYE